MRCKWWGIHKEVAAVKRGNISIIIIIISSSSSSSKGTMVSAVSSFRPNYLPTYLTLGTTTTVLLYYYYYSTTTTTTTITVTSYLILVAVVR